MGKFIKNKKGELIECPPYKCKMCGEYEVEFPHDICRVCGWQDDVVQNKNHNYEGGANYISFNQYKKVWDDNKAQIKNEEFGKMRMVREIFKKQYNDKQ